MRDVLSSEEQEGSEVTAVPFPLVRAENLKVGCGLYWRLVAATEEEGNDPVTEAETEAEAEEEDVDKENGSVSLMEA